MPQTRKLVRDAMRTALQDPENGFNALIAEVAPEYGIEPFEIDWNPQTSETFIEGYVNTQPATSSRLLREIRAFIATSVSEQSRDTQRDKGAAFHGLVTAHLGFVVEFTAGVVQSENETEAYADAIEDVVIRIFLDPNGYHSALFRSGPLMFSGDFACARTYLEETNSGFKQELPFTFTFELRTR